MPGFVSHYCLPSSWHDRRVEGEPAVHMLIQCTPLLVEKAGVAPDMTIRFIVHKQTKVQMT